MDNEAIIQAIETNSKLIDVLKELHQVEVNGLKAEIEKQNIRIENMERLLNNPHKEEIIL